MTKRFLSLFFLLSFAGCISNKPIREINFTEFLSYAYENEDSTSIILCDFRQFYHLTKDHFWRRVIKDKKGCLFYTDVSLLENRDALYILKPIKTPVLLSFSPEGDILSIQYQGSTNLQQEHNRRTIKLLLHGFYELKHQQLSESTLYSLSRLARTDKDLYAANLLAENYNNIGIIDSVYYYNQLMVEEYEKSPEIMFDILYVKALKNIKDTIPHLVIEKQIMDLRDFPINQDTTVIFKVKNYGERPFLIYDVRTTCSCIRLRYPHIIKANHADTLFMDYHASADSGAFEQSAFINSSVYGNKFKLTIKGNKR